MYISTNCISYHRVEFLSKTVYQARLEGFFVIVKGLLQWIIDL